MSESEKRLLEAVLVAHHQSSFRNNASSASVVNAAAGSGDLVKAITAGLMTLGWRHAPIEETCNLLRVKHPAALATDIVRSGEKVPGWGGTFQKDQPDPIWNEVSKLLVELYPALAMKLDDVTQALHAEGKRIYPNPSAYTAAAGIALGMPTDFAVFLFVVGRLDAWARLALDKIKELGGGA